MQLRLWLLLPPWILRPHPAQRGGCGGCCGEEAWASRKTQPAALWREESCVHLIPCWCHCETSPPPSTDEGLPRVPRQGVTHHRFFPWGSVWDVSPLRSYLRTTGSLLTFKCQKSASFSKKSSLIDLC